jgi:hypothetical protein
MAAGMGGESMKETSGAFRRLFASGGGFWWWCSEHLHNSAFMLRAALGAHQILKVVNALAKFVNTYSFWGRIRRCLAFLLLEVPTGHLALSATFMSAHGEPDVARAAAKLRGMGYKSRVTEGGQVVLCPARGLLPLKIPYGETARFLSLGPVSVHLEVGDGAYWRLLHRAMLLAFSSPSAMASSFYSAGLRSG